MTQQAYPIRCRIRNEADGTRVDVFDDVGAGGWFSEGLTAKDFAAQLSKATGALFVHISSGGGDCFDGVAIATAIRNYQGDTTTFNDGIAASIASVIFQAGKTRVAEAGSMTMIHDAFGLVMGNAQEARKFADVLDQVSDNIAGIYADRAGGTREQWRDAMRAETWYDADEAVAAGLADRKGTGTAQLPAGLDLAAFTAVPGRIAAALRAMPQAKAPDATAGGGGGGGGASSTTTTTIAGGGISVTSGSPLTYTITSGTSGGGGGSAAPVIADADGQAGGANADHDEAGHGHAHGAGAQDRAPKVKGKKARKEARLRGGAQPGACCPQCGPDCACGGQPAAHGTLTVDAQFVAWLRDAVRAEIRAAAVDESDWDASKAWSAGAASDDPAGFYGAICAGEKTGGDADTQGHWALPHHYAPGKPPNRNGVNAAKGRIGQTDGLKDKGAARAHLDAHSAAMGSAGDGDAGNHAQHDISGIDLEQIRAALKGAVD